MSRPVARYADGELRVRVPEALVRRAAVRLRVQGAAGLDRVGARVRRLVRDLGGRRGRGRPKKSLLSS